MLLCYPNLVFYKQLLFFIFLFVGIQFYATAQSTLEASTNDNDAFIMVNWNLDKNCFANDSDQAYEEGVFLQLKANGVVIYTETIIQDAPTVVQNSYQHDVGPDANITYQLNLYEIGPGSPPCAPPMSTTGTTTSFSSPSITNVTTNSVEHIIIDWESDSKLASRFILYRDEEVIANIDAEDDGDYRYYDTYKFNDTTSIVNGASYNYCIEAFSDISNQTYPPVCISGRTFDINLQASDDAFNNKVELIWRNGISSYWDKIQLYRNGELIGTINNMSITSFIDPSPVPGKKSNYSFELFKNGVALAGDSDIGSIPKNGQISGQVLTLDNLYPVMGAKIVLSGVAGDTIVKDSVVTDFAGFFSFDAVYYDQAATFTLTASLGDNNFENNPQQVTLLKLKPVTMDLLFLQDEDYETDEDGTLAASDLVLTPVAAQDKVDISWTYTLVSGETTFFNLFRGSSLIASLNDKNGAVTSFSDLDGEPNKSATYRLVVYRINANQQVVQVPLQGNTIFPEVSVPNNFIVQADNTNGFATMTWDAHPSNNFAGFFLYRNGERIATLDTDATNYSDHYAAPGTTVTYSISAYRIVSDVNKESLRRSDSVLTFPTLPAAENASAAAQSGQDKIDVSWTVPTALTNTYNFSGFAVYRKENGTTDKTLIATKYKGFALAGNTLTITDYTGIPNQAYTYEICTFLATPDSTYHANAVMAAATFPVVTPATALTGTPDLSRVTLNWTAPTSNNLDGLTIFRNGTDSLATVNQKVVAISDEMPEQGVSYDYSVKAYRIVEGQIYYSTSTEVTDISTTTWSGSPIIPAKFTTTDDLPGVVKLCWEYPEFALSTFEIRREGVLIATLPTTARAYYDYDGTTNKSLYELRAIYNGTATNDLRSFGKKSCANRLNGRVYSSTKKIGVSNVRVTASTTSFFAYVLTDASGYYEFKNLPNGNITIEIEGNNANWLSANGTKTIDCNTQEYQQDFINNYEVPTFESDEIRSLHVLATANSDILDVMISWSPTNENYDGFEINRGTKILGEVPADTDYRWIDKDGAPGYIYAYQVRAFQDTEDGRRYADYAAIGRGFPRLLPVEYLTALPYPDKNAVRLQWTHRQDVDLSYVVERNGTTVATLENPERLEFIDETGLPGQLYTYTVTAYYQNNTGLFASEERSVTMTYPEVLKPRSLEIDTPTKLSFTCVGGAYQSFTNQVEISWAYTENAATAFEIYRGLDVTNSQLIGKVDGNVLSFTDSEPAYNTSVQYEVRAIVEKNGQEYASRAIREPYETPGLASPVLASEVIEGVIELRMAYLFYDADIIKIYRSTSSSSLGTQIGTINIQEERSFNIFTTEVIEFFDKDGVPNTDYFYHAVAHTSRSGVQHPSSISQACEVTYPDVPTPTNVQASDNHQNYVEVTWDYPTDAKVSHFIIERGRYSPLVILPNNPNGSFIVNSTHIVDGVERSFREFFGGNISADGSGNPYDLYRVRAVRGTHESPSDALNTTFPSVDKGAINQNPESSLLGNKGSKDVCIQGNYIVLGHPSATTNATSSSLDIYAFDGTSWQETSLNRSANGFNNYANAVDFSYPYVAAGTINAGQDRVSIYKINGNSLDFIDNEIEADHLYGHSVGLSSSQVIVGLPSFGTTNSGRTEYLDLENGALNFDFGIEPNNLGESNREKGRFGYDLAFDGDYVMIGEPGIGASPNIAGKVYFYNTQSNNDYVALSASDGSSDNKLGAFVDLHGDYAIASSFAGAYIYKKSNSGTWQEQTKLVVPDGGGAYEPVAIYGDIAAGFHGTLVDIYKRDANDNWSFVKRHNGVVSDFVVLSADISQDFLVVGSENETKIFDLLNTPENLQATDGEFLSKTTLTWDYTEVQNIDGFRIYRNGEEIGTVGKTLRSYNDTEGMAGIKYAYEIEAYASDRNSNKIAAEGHRLPNGSISGEVITLIGQSPVQDVIITAEAIIDNVLYSYETLTDNAGQFEFSEMFYGEGDAEYSIKATYLNHDFEPTTITKTLNASQSTASGILIFDKTAFIVKGLVKFENTECGIEGVEVKAISVLTTGDEIPSTVKTNMAGEYSVTINPMLNNLDFIKIEIANEQTFEEEGVNLTTLFNFDAVGDDDGNNSDHTFIIQDLGFENLQQTTIINFLEKTTYAVPVKLASTCGEPISTNRYTLRVRNTDGCLDKSYQLNSDGSGLLEIPPLNGIIINAVDVEGTDVTDLLVLDYLKYRPSGINLFDYHQALREESHLEVPEIKLTYHKPPVIQSSLFPNYLCGDLSSVARVEQGETYSIDFNISETHSGIACDVKEGFIVISNPAAQESKTILQFDENTQQFETYQFLGGLPNLVSPHLWVMKAEYFAADGSFLASKSTTILVEGEAGVPGNDVITLPDNVPTPLFILRDPPGDGSNATISSGQTYKKSFTFNWGGGISSSIFANHKFEVASFVIKGKLEVSSKQEFDRKINHSISVTTSQSISTSTSQGKIGESADIIVGNGIAYQYGIVEQIKVTDCDNNEISRFIKYGITPNQITTTFVHTVAHIENIITGLDHTLTQLDLIPEEDQQESHEETITVTENAKDNWTSVLDYHRNQAVPYNYICNSDGGVDEFRQDYVDNLPNYIIQERKNEIEEWQNGFCEFLTDKGLNSDDFFWDDRLSLAYGNTVTAIRILSDSLLAFNDQTGILVTDWHYDGESSSLLSTELQQDRETNPNIIEFINLFGNPAENTTFSGGTSITKNVNIGHSSSNSFNFKLTNAITVSAELGAENEISVATGLGVSIITNLTSFSTTGGAKISGSFKYGSDATRSASSANKISYKLSDGDTGDQFSVTAIQPIQTTHSPYFTLVGGRSSCPPEPGTILRDKPKLQIVEGQGAVQASAMYNVPENEFATFNLKIINNSVFGETRSLVVYLDNQTNENGAIVRLAGQLMGQQTFYSVGPNQELVLPVTIERGLVAYEHNDIQLKIRPFCTDGNVKWPDPDSVSFTAHFQNPCSPISIVTPDDNWIINGEEDNLVIGLRDYQTDNEIFQELKLQYRRTDVGDNWDDLPGRHVSMELNDPLDEACNPLPYPVSKECLASYNNAFFAPGAVPTFFMIWDFPDNFTEYPDGDYEIRAVAACGTAGVTYSNVIGGKIDRSNIRLFGQPEPADGLWIPGDEISTDFNKNLDCSLFDDADFIDTSFFLYHKPSGTGDVDLATLNRVPATAVCRNNELIFETIAPMSTFDGDSLIAILANVNDLSGNKSDTIRWEFKVITSKLYWGEEEITVELYQGEDLTVRVPLLSTEVVAPVDNAILSRSGASADWLNFSPSGTFSVQPTGRTITFTISGNSIGNFEETILVNANGLTTALPIKIKAIVRAKAPNWEVDPNDYSETMVMVTNYIFEDEPSKLSTDSLDMLSVWIDGEIRGVAKIEKAGMFHAAYLVIYGNPEDYGHPMDFRVWKATEGVDYDAFATEEIIYDGGSTRGSTADPEILTIDRLTGKATYLPLNQGWTYFSINKADIEDDFSLNNMLKSLRKVSPADEVLTQDKFAEYVAGQGWITAGQTTLTDVNVHESYRIYLENGPDTLRLTGKDAIFENITLEDDWSWIGYPLQSQEPINDVLNFLNTPTNGDKIYSIPQTGGVEIANFDGTNWTGNLTNLKPNFAYKLNIADPNILVYPSNPALNNSGQTELRGPTIADPTDETTWMVEDYNMEFVTTLVAELTVNNELTTDVNDKLAVFMDNELRGVANVEYVAAVDRYLAVMSIGSFAVGEDLDLFLYDASIDEILPIQEPMATLQDAGYGQFTEPTPLTAAIFNVEIVKEDVLCNTDQSGRAEVVVDNNVGTLTYLWNTGATTSSIENLSAGTYTVSIRDFRNIPVEINVEVFNLDADIAAPTLAQSVMGGCQGSSITATVSHPTYPNGVMTWFDENNQIIHTGTSLTLNNLQAPRSLKVATSVNTCPSDFATLNVFVHEWAEADFSADDRTPLKDIQAVTFTPVVQDPTVTYNWSFGDGESSSDMIAQHTYTTAGSFTVVLTTSTINNCGYTSFSSDYIVTDGSQEICEETLDSDADGWKNDCDNCPSVSNALQTDNDNDQIGAACDCDDNNPNDISRDLSGIVATGVYRSNYYIMSDGLVKEEQEVEFRAGKEITLEPGFEVHLNAEFLAMIEPCENPSFQEENTAENRVTDNLMNETLEGIILGEDVIKIKPNPFSGQTTIYYELAETSFVHLTVHSLAGEKLETLVLNEEQEAGIHSFPFYANNIPAGMYYVVLKAGKEIKIQKMVMTK